MKCAALIFWGSMALTPSLQMRVEELPPPDPYGRFETLNQMGMIDPQSNEIVDEFVEWGASHAQKAPPGSTYREQMYVMEIAGGFGFVSSRLIQKGAYVLFNDWDARHVEIAEGIFGNVDRPANLPSQYETIVGKYPDEFKILKIREFYPLIAIGKFQALHFHRPAEIRASFDTAWDLLVPGGRFFVTAGTPWNRQFVGFPKEYQKRKKAFFRNPEAAEMFPGEIPDAEKYLPQHKYPSYFHALDIDTLTYLAQMNPGKRFEVVKSVMIQRPNPPDQAYRRGYAWGHTEIVGMIFEKPFNP